jgi:hypothetical protein
MGWFCLQNNARKSRDLRALLFGEQENATGVF